MEKFSELYTLISYDFNDPTILEQAFKQERYVNKHNNKALAILGDSIIKSEMMSFLLNLYRAYGDRGVGLLLDYPFIKHYLDGINGDDYLLDRLYKLGINKAILFKDNVDISQVEECGALIMRAIIGAIYMDLEFDNREARDRIERLISPLDYILYKDGINYYERVARFCIRNKNKKLGFYKERYRDEMEAGEINKEFSNDRKKAYDALFDYLYIRDNNEADDLIIDSSFNELDNILNMDIDDSSKLRIIEDKRLLSRPAKRSFINGRDLYEVRLSVLEYKCEFIGMGSDYNSAYNEAIGNLLNKIKKDIRG